MTAVLSATAYKITTVLRNHPLREFQEIELIHAANTGKGAAAILIHQLVQEGFLQERRVGRAKMVSWNLSNPQTIVLQNILDQEKIRLLSPSQLAAALLFKRAAGSAIVLMVIFGSTTAGTAAPHSDIDLLLVSDRLPALEKARKKAEEYLGERLNLHIYSEKEINEKVKTDSFIQNALLQGVILRGSDLLQEIYVQLKAKNVELFTRLDYFKERIMAARRNYNHKDAESAQEIINRVQEQLIFYILTVKGISYKSKKDAWETIKKIPEGRVFISITRSPLKEKIDKLEVIFREILIKMIMEEEGYGSQNRN